MPSKEKLEAILEWLQDKKAENIRIYDVEKTSGYTDVIVVCEGGADLHNKAIANHLIDMAKEYSLSVMSKEGIDFGHWILIDIGDVIVHIFLSETRDYYKIDELFERVKKRQLEEIPE
ncbi:MAG: ribosome silencing factor [Candidatus Cloacimonadaceae bacterium]|nr:ribosome silencing factor [Candidatus Cloacimonadaceae bacterium]